MFRAVRRFIKTAIVFLMLGIVLGVYMLVRRELAGAWPDPYLVSAHTHLLFVGFVMFLILGVALWIFPRPAKTDTRYEPRMIDAAYWLLLCGTVARVAGEILRVEMSTAWLKLLVVLGGGLQAVGLALYFWTMWTRIRPVGSRLREGRGERF